MKNYLLTAILIPFFIYFYNPCRIEIKNRLINDEIVSKADFKTDRKDGERATHNANGVNSRISELNFPYKTYATSFTGNESPISEDGNWINGSTVGLDWGYVSISEGQTHTHPGSASYADATALLTGNWGTDQVVQATVGSTVHACMLNNCYPEVELRLRSILSAHVCNGYEVTFSLKHGSKAYLIIVRWNGPLGDFTYLFNQSGSQFQAKTGDEIKATIKGNIISAFKNGELMGQARDSTFVSGNPGMGFNEQSNNGDYGFTSFTASDNPEYGK